MSGSSYSAGDLLREVLNSRSSTQASLAAAMKRPAQMVSEIVTGKKRITPRTAVELESALAIPAEVWLIAQTVHDLRAGEPHD